MTSSYKGSSSVTTLEGGGGGGVSMSPAVSDVLNQYVSYSS